MMTKEVINSFVLSETYPVSDPNRKARTAVTQEKNDGCAT